MIKDLNLEQKNFDLEIAQTHLKELVAQVETKRAPKYLMKDDKPVAVLVNAEVYQAILDYLEELEEAEDIKAIEEYEAKVVRGEAKFYSLEEVEAELDALPD